MKSVEDYVADCQERHRKSAPLAIGRRIGPDDDEDDLATIVDRGLDPRCWAEGRPWDRKGMVAVFHPAALCTSTFEFCQELAKRHNKTVHAIQQRGTRWVYIFLHNPIARCGNESPCECEICAGWFETDSHEAISPGGDITLISAS